MTDPADFIVDLAHAEIVSGNEAARRLFLGRAEPGANGFDLSLDRAMPALATLVGVAGAAGEVPCTLVLWTLCGVERIEAVCQPVSSPYGIDCVRVIERPRPAPEPVEDRPLRLNGRAGPDPAYAVLADPVPAHPPLVDAAEGDTATLAAIARRIRNGLAKPAAERASAAEPPAPLSFRARAAAAADSPAAHATLACRGPVEAAARSEALASGSAAVPTEADPPPAVDVRLARLAHEIRTPLAAVAALAEIMRDEQLGPLANARYRGYAGDIHQSATHALALLEDALDVGADARAPSSGSGPLDANRAIAGAVAAMDPFADRAGVMLVAELRPRLPPPAIDQRALTQVLFNLLTNAFNHTPRGGRITVSAEARGGDGWLALVVEDSGRGMSEADIQAALSRPVAAGRPGSSPSGSTGFGLPIVRDLVTAAGGTLAIDSEVGAGTRIRIALPPWRPA